MLNYKYKHQKYLSEQGFTLVEIMIVVAIIGLLAAIGIPNFVRARQTAQTNACINNLRIIDEAKQEWALETGQLTSAVPLSSDIIPYLGHTQSIMPSCPIGHAVYNIMAVTVVPTCPNSTASSGTHYAILSF
jgi:prepilin-type N-terminal cleavage/methylation domain-containing protein